MKKLLCIGAILFSFSFINAQEISDHAIGLRLGSNDGIGTEISYQKSIGDNNRLEIDLGWRSSNSVDVIKLTGLYQWVWVLDGQFNWYAGAGGGFLSWNHDKSDTNGTALFAAGDIGIEYNFDFPLLISLDIRPELGFSEEYNNDLDLDIALGVRYKF